MQAENATEKPLQHQVIYLFLATLALGALLSRLLSRSLYQRRIARRFARAKQKEEEARVLLESEGFEVLASQVPGSISVRHNQRLLSSRLRADYLVRKSGKIYIAEVKSGQYATEVVESHTRRQLLEYAVSYQADGLLLVNMETEQISEVEFPALRRRGMSFSAKLLLWLFGVICGLLLSQWLFMQPISLPAMTEQRP